MWIENDYQNRGYNYVGFLVCRVNQHGTERYNLEDHPPHGNTSGKPTPCGWCGTYNNIATYGMGVWRIVRIARNGRIEIAEVTDKDNLMKYLDDVGYPDLITQIMEERS